MDGNFSGSFHRAPASCAVCGKATEAKFRPFCSARCADVDLHRWLGGVYRVETAEQPAPAPSQAPDEDA